MIKLSKNITQDLIYLIKYRTLKFHHKMDDITFFYINYLCEQTSLLLKENKIIKENLFQVEQESPPDQKWENVLAAKLNRVLQQGKKDFLEITNSINNDIFVITIQKKFGRTPEQLLEQAQIRKLKAIKKLVNIIKDSKNIKRKLLEQEKDIKALTFLKMDSPEDILQTHSELQRAIDKINQLTRTFNIALLKRVVQQFPNHHLSFKEAFEEAWRRGSNAEWKLSAAEQKIIRLERCLMAKKNFYSRIYKGKR